MPFNTHPYHPNSPINLDLSWFTRIMSPFERDIPASSPMHSCLNDCLAQAVEAEAPTSSFRQEILRAWAASCSDRGSGYTGHA